MLCYYHLLWSSLFFQLVTQTNRLTRFSSVLSNWQNHYQSNGLQKSTAKENWKNCKRAWYNKLTFECDEYFRKRWAYGCYGTVYVSHIYNAFRKYWRKWTRACMARQHLHGSIISAMTWSYLYLSQRGSDTVLPVSTGFPVGQELPDCTQAEYGSKKLLYVSCNPGLYLH